MDSPKPPKSAKTDKQSPSTAAAAAAESAVSPTLPTKSTSPVVNAGPEIETLQDATNEAYTPPPKPVEKKLKRRKSRSKRSQKLRAERRRVKDLENRRRQKILHRDNDIVAESAPAASVPAENPEETPVTEGSEDFLNGLLEAQRVPDSPLLDEEGNPEEEDMCDDQPLVRVIKAVSNLVHYLMEHPLVPVAIGVALLIILTGKL
ncbi:hypothetical protein PRIPAC_84962 [Pristionchus pacificus]|uniref:Uncharacterized protein n=1 Tax=Pristionchus pacificus TaxID=54126 RepID=A0A2A6BGT0_PRIPA|nr:hypothetical protein PRIPAC_84962 [Pristionchus pacificus]|eukprot:PDM65066.1 hypothetical protein PRIPAC_53315 [Pristionchus pacificus]